MGTLMAVVHVKIKMHLKTETYESVSSEHAKQTQGWL